MYEYVSIATVGDVIKTVRRRTSINMIIVAKHIGVKKASSSQLTSRY